MNSTPVPPAKSSTAFLCLFLGLVIVPSALMGLLVLGVTGYFRLSSDTRALRSGLIAASGADWHQKIALNVGGFTLGLARAGLSFVPLDEPARAALQTVRGGEVGIFELSAEKKLPDRAAMLVAADKAMGARGWERAVGVMDEHDLVAIYVPVKNVSLKRLHCCVLVFDGRQMVLVSARTNPQPLVECLLKQPAAQAKLKWLAKR